MARYVWDKERETWVPRSEYKPAGLTLIHEIESFKSPVTNQAITNRRELREHNRLNNVVDRREFEGHRYETERMPSAGADVARAFKENTGRF